MSENLTSVMVENRAFPPPADFSAKARIASEEAWKELYDSSRRDPEAFWESEARELVWQQPWTQALKWEHPHAEWFLNGRLNVTESCLDRHVREGRGDKAALLFEGEPGDARTVTYSELLADVCRMANVLKAKGIQSGDRVLIYMPMTPEAVAAMLACARIGAVHSVVFGGFSADSIKDRLLDSKAIAVITADGGWRRGKVIPLKANVDKALESVESVRHVLVQKRGGNEVTMREGRDSWLAEEMEKVSDECPPEIVDSEHPLFILYTSGSTGKPKGILHTTGGYLTGTYATCKYIFDMRGDDVYWCTADIGWITGHSYVAYGPLANGVTQVIYEGAPNYPDWDRFWAIVAKYGITILYTAPTAIRAFIKAGDELPAKHDLSSLRLLGSVGEPINPEAWMWYHEKIGGGRCPIVDTWWQTETGSILISPIPGATSLKPGTATLPFFGIDAAVVDDEGNEVTTPGGGGKLVIRKPWPSMLRTIYGDPQRYVDTYWKEYADKGGYYLAGDGAHRDEDGYFWIMGRLDDVLNVSGHRLGTAEVESALVAHPAVAEAAVVGRPDDLKGQAVVAFVTVKTGVSTSSELSKELRNHVADVIGAIARPDDVRFAAALPKTRSGKIMRRLLKEIASNGTITGDTTTLEDFAAIQALTASGTDED